MFSMYRPSSTTPCVIRFRITFNRVRANSGNLITLFTLLRYSLGLTCPATVTKPYGSIEMIDPGGAIMENAFGDIALFNRAKDANWDGPLLAAYLRSTGLSETEVEEVRSLFEVFRSAIDNSGVAALPEITSEGASTKMRITSLN